MLYHGTVAALYPGGQLLNGHAMDTRYSLVGSNLLPGFLKIGPVQCSIE